ncbi:MAG: hypothetical protein COA50_08390 [Flavobacteriaceae bacterium]|nr:hypothetical protein [Sneathiella sp.]PCJ95631.1 MAG: hypothetical protein COA50_08390 [Flavobacteriaceae bacterium]
MANIKKKSMRQLILILLLTFTGLSSFSQNLCPDREVWKNKIYAGDEKCIDDWTRIATFEARKCQCERGWALIDGHKITAPETDLKQLESQLEILKYQIQHEQMYSSCIAEYTPNYSPCRRNGGDITMEQYKSGNFPKSNEINKLPSNSNSGNDVLETNSSVVVKDEYLGFLNQLAGQSKDPDFREMVNTMNENHETVSFGKNFIMNLGIADQNDIDFYNMTENLAQAVAVGVWVASWFKKEEVILNESQEEAFHYISNLSTQLRRVFNEVRSIPTYLEFSQNTLSKLEIIEEQFILYKNSTIIKRALFWEYQKFEGYLTIDQLQETRQNLMKLSNKELLLKIDNAVKYFSASEAFAHMLNSSNELVISQNKILFSKAKCYESMGKVDLADEIFKKLNISTDPNSAINGLIESIKVDNTAAILSFYDPLKTYFLQKKEVSLYYSELVPILTTNNEGLSRVSATYLMCLGALIYSKSGQLSQAQEELVFLQFFDKELKNWMDFNKSIKEKKKAHGDLKIQNEYNLAHSFVLATEALILSKQHSYDLAIEKINESISLDENTNNLGNLTSPYLLFKLEIKFQIMLSKKNYQEANNVAREIKIQQRTSKAIDFNFFDDKKFRYSLAFLNFTSKKYNKALISLEFLKKKNPKNPKYYSLQKSIYLAMGENDKATILGQQYEKLILEK